LLPLILKNLSDDDEEKIIFFFCRHRSTISSATSMACLDGEEGLMHLGWAYIKI
jgi:hypothetical protein